MLPSTKRFSRSKFQEFLISKGIFVVFNQLGTLKYIPSSSLMFSVVTSSKHEKSAVKRNTLRRRVYTTIGSINPAIKGILYVSKQSYGFPYPETVNLLNDLLAKAQKNTK